MQAHPQYVRLSAYHGPKRQLLGNQAGSAPPAWRINQPATAKRPIGSMNAVEKGSKILLSRLPLDVGESEVELLFTKTVGPVKDVFLVYNSQAKSKGMAVVTFQRPGDAAVARQKYNGKIVDGKRPIKIEVVIDEDQRPQAAPAKPQAPSLLQRLGAVVPPLARPAAAPILRSPIQKRGPQQAATPAAAAPRRPNAKEKLRIKKGPKRVKKSVAQLDQEMDEYRAGGEV
ncbi:hypothetical protein BKA93DRAFT_801971 [Sparassis latifolia]|uniref:mRNA export protein n=1 Tax=Sparassis crispa TaxID=139825 RepID=A0A401H2J5_9APHY|nr:mRNA export protein [Sparassis crispa]GBE88613.1 mRNA export protein [Sparassis crispa]